MNVKAINGCGCQEQGKKALLLHSQHVLLHAQVPLLGDERLQLLKLYYAVLGGR